MYSRIHFEGEWPAPEIRTVTEAIRRAEARIEAAPAPSYGKTWVCIRERIEAGRVFYIASRFGFHSTLKALTAGSLAERIDEFGEAAVPYAD